jgi:glc operon protein GlcG
MGKTGVKAMAITLEESERILNAAKKKAEKMGLKVAISIVDPRGDLVTMARLDGALWRAIPISQGKAVASAAYGVPTRDLHGRAAGPVMRSLVQYTGGYMTPQQGGLPILRGAVLLGAIGVSGAKSEEDEVIAQAGIDAL